MEITHYGFDELFSWAFCLAASKSPEKLSAEIEFFFFMYTHKRLVYNSLDLAI